MAHLSIFISDPSPFLTNYRPYGDGLMAWEFITRLAARGHRVDVAASSVDISGIVPSGVSIHSYRAEAPFSIFVPFLMMAHIKRALKKVRGVGEVDLVHQLNPVTDGLSALIGKSGLPLVLGPFVPSWPRESPSRDSRISAMKGAMRLPALRLIDSMDRAQEVSAKLLLLSTPAARKALREPHTCGEKIGFLPYGVDTNVFSPGKAGRGGETQVILFLASLSKRKGIFTLLDAFDMIAGEMPRCVLEIGGEGEELPTVKSRIASSPFSTRIKLLGAIPRVKLAERMRGCTVYCLPSFGEPFGVAALEAMACGKPVVATRAGGLEHLVEEKGGHMVEPGNSFALAGSLKQILGDTDLQASMGIHNRNLVVERYDWVRIIDQLEVYYAGLTR